MIPHHHNLAEENVRFWGLRSTVILRNVAYKSADLMYIAAEARNRVYFL